MQYLLDLLGSTELRMLFARVAESPVTRDSLIEMRLPLGMSVIEAEGIIEKITQLFASWYPIVNEDGVQYWFYPAKELIRLMREIDLKTAHESPIYAARSSEQGIRLDLAALRTAATLVCELSGFEIEPKRSKQLIILEDAPRDDAERVLVNTFQTLTDLSRLASESSGDSISLIDSIFDSITCSIPSAEKEALCRTDELTRKGLLDILEVGSSCWSDISPLLDVILIRWSLVHLRPFGAYSLIVADIYARQLLIRLGYPDLRFIPFFTTRIPGVRGLMRHSTNTYSKAGPLIHKQVPIRNGNLTPLLMSDLEDMNKAIDEQIAAYRNILEKDERAYAILKNDLTLNYRQRSILERALRMPDATFYTRYHQKTHGIAYSTARKDLFSLANVGYLTCEREGKTNVFRAAPNIVELIGKRAGEPLPQ